MDLKPPLETEVEITIFGPGFGECILVHAGFNEWIVVDSCLDSTSGRPAALSHLESIGVDPASAIKFVLVTHWHDDHIGGMAELLAACTRAEFACSAALTQSEFLKFLEILNSRSLFKQSSGASELHRIFSLLRTRHQRPKFAIADRPLLRLASDPRTAGSICELVALSPSDLEIQRFLQAVSGLIPQTNSTKFRLPSPKQNDLSVAAWLSVGPLQILLGADLEERGIAGRGWIAVVGSPTRPQAQASLFKMAHHGSETGHFDPVWTRMLDARPVAVLTPWTLGGSQLPSAGDCRRIMGLTPFAYSTSRPRPQRVRNLPAPVARTLREGNIVVTDSEPPTGSVQLRTSIDGSAPWKVALSAEAMSLTDYLRAIAR